MYEENNKTIWCGNLAEEVTEEILYELFLQAGPLEKVKLVKDRDGRHRNYAFITYRHEVSVPYALNLFMGTSLYSKALTLQCRGHMVALPPPIRAYGDEIPLEINDPNIVQLFATMTENIRDVNQRPMPLLRSEMDHELVKASLQGNWLLRHHPYQPNEDLSSGRNNYRHHRNHDSLKNRDNNKNNSSHWRENKRSKRYRRH